MARYPSSSYRRRRSRRLIYIISASLIIVSYCVYRIAYRNAYHVSHTTVETLTDTSAENGIAPPLVVPPKLAPGATLIYRDAPEPTAESNPEVAELIVKAMEHINTKPARIIEARDILNKALIMPMSRGQRAFVKTRLSELADKWLFSKTVFPQDRLCGGYKVKRGELLSTIGKQFKVPYEILMEINKISRPQDLQAGETIKVVNGPFHARIYRSTFTMDLYLQNTFVRSFPVGLGQPGRETPTGLWVVEPGGKLIKPVWRDPDTGKVHRPEDPDYPLGSRWIGLKGIKGDAVGRTGIAFHGWKNSELMAGGGSRGCIRMHNGDAILIYNLLVPSYSQVEVVE